MEMQPTSRTASENRRSAASCPGITWKATGNSAWKAVTYTHGWPTTTSVRSHLTTGRRWPAPAAR
jgi:Outer membrane cobalamin receptor protein